MDFPCIECGLCCRLSGKVPQLQPLQTEKGLCRYFDEATNRCQIYRTRPTICNTEKMYALYFKDLMSEAEYIRQNLRVCYELNKEKGNVRNMERIATLMKQFEK